MDPFSEIKDPNPAPTFFLIISLQNNTQNFDISLLSMSIIFMCIKKTKKSDFLKKKLDIPVVLVDFYVNLPRFFATRIRFIKQIRRNETDPSRSGFTLLII